MSSCRLRSSTAEPAEAFGIDPRSSAGRAPRRRGIARTAPPLALVAACAMLAACQSELASNIDPDLGVSASPIMVGSGKPVPRGGGRKQVGEPYKVGGRWFHPKEDADYEAVGMASWYGRKFHGRKTANGEVFDMNRLTGAHPTLPLPSYVKVTNLANDRSVVVRINDRGPFHRSRLIDVSAKTAELLKFKNAGRAKVKVEYVGPARLDGKDDTFLVASYRGPAEGGAPERGRRNRRSPTPEPIQGASAGAGEGGWFARWSGGGREAAGTPAAAAATEPATSNRIAANSVTAAPAATSSATAAPTAAAAADPIGSAVVAYAAPAPVSQALAASQVVAADDAAVLDSLIEQYDAAERAVPAGQSVSVDAADPVAGLIGTRYLKNPAAPPAPTAYDDQRVGAAHALFSIVDNGAMAAGQ